MYIEQDTTNGQTIFLRSPVIKKRRFSRDGMANRPTPGLKQKNTKPEVTSFGIVVSARALSLYLASLTP